MTVHTCASAKDPTCSSLPSQEVGLLALPSSSQLIASLGAIKAKVLHLSDAERAFGAFGSAANAKPQPNPDPDPNPIPNPIPNPNQGAFDSDAESRTFHQEANPNPKPNPNPNP